jgi:hypothetical protein
MSRSTLHLFTAVLFAIASPAVIAQDTLPYKDGAVVIVTSVRTQPGKFNEYFRYLSGPYSQIMEQAKKEGVVTSYSFSARSPSRPTTPTCTSSRRIRTWRSSTPSQTR